MPSAPQPIIVVKKKGGHHGGHHGGAWKVAYADFVTAMMALFIVLWLMNSTPQVKKAISGYFRNPDGSGRKFGSAVGGTGDGLFISKQNMAQLKDKLEGAIKNSPEFGKLKNNIEMTITGEGLRIELVETQKGIFFESGQSTPTPLGRDLLIKLAQELGTLQSPIMVEGHTDSQQYGAEAYTNWELSADRANAARRMMQNSGLRTGQVTQVRGFADQQLRVPSNPQDPSNRRISIIVEYPHKPSDDEAEEKSPQESRAPGGSKTKEASTLARLNTKSPTFSETAAPASGEKR